jgi:hypothetical protein
MFLIPIFNNDLLPLAS